MSEAASRAGASMRERFMRFVVPEPYTGCWLWDGYVCKYGYGRFYRPGESALAHRAAYEIFRSPILPGLQVDHLCRVRFCVNPWHLELVTALEHARRTTVAQPKAKLRFRRIEQEPAHV